MQQTSQAPQDGVIAVLPPELANQIAAGEVVERPASVVKELVENSLDAGGQRISVTIEGGGRRRIGVTDDGCGMSPEEARLSLQRHATSKLRTFDDLRHITTLGFRGEALPSIASVSRFSLTTRRESDLEGSRIQVHGGEIVDTAPASCPAGTEILVDELFYNTPARLKFLKSEGTERRHISEAMTRLALARPNIHVKLRAEGRVVIDAAPCIDLKERVSAVLGTKVSDQLYQVPDGVRRGDVTVRGLFSSPSVARRNSAGLYTFVNGRYVRDQRVLAAIKMGYGTLIEKGRFPTVVLYIELPPEDLDVNVHPAKTEVRFHHPDHVFRAVRASVVDGLSEAPWIPKSGKARKVYTLEAGEGAVFEPRPSLHLTGGAWAPEPVQETLAIGRRFDGVAPAGEGSGRGPESRGPGGWWTSGIEPKAAGLTDPGAPPRHNYFSDLSYLSKLGTVYLLCQDEEGLVVIDQHAAHERITFERLKAIYIGHHRHVQSLLLPIQLELDGGQVETLRDHRPFFEAMGFEVDAFSDDSYVLRSVPAVLLGASYQRLIRDALDELAHSGHTQRVDEAMDAVLSRMACHGSVRAGDRMAPEEVDALLRQMDAIDFRGNCPHGRPVYFRMGWAEIEKRFDRT